MIGIIQGRLSQDRRKKRLQYLPNNFEKEFKVASKLGFNYIELITDEINDQKNPIWNKNKIKKYKKTILNNKLILYSFLDNYPINNDIREIKSKRYYKKLTKKISFLKVKYLILPFYSKSLMTNLNLETYLDFINYIIKQLKTNKIELLIETDISAKSILILQKKLSQTLNIVYDTGNRFFIDKNSKYELLKLKNNIKHVHMKDKNRDKKNTKLGNGVVNFKDLFKIFKTIKYKGSYTFETVRGKNSINTAIHNLDFISKLFKYF